MKRPKFLKKVKFPILGIPNELWGFMLLWLVCVFFLVNIESIRNGFFVASIQPTKAQGKPDSKINTYIGGIHLGGFDFTFNETCSVVINNSAALCAGQTDQERSILILSNISLDYTKRICSHEICHSLIFNIPMEEEEYICDHAPSFDVCDQLITILEAIPPLPKP